MSTDLPDEINMTLHFSIYKGCWVLTTAVPNEEPTEEYLSISEAVKWKDLGVPNTTSDKHKYMVPAMLDIFA